MKAKFIKWTSFFFVLFATSTLLISCEPEGQAIVPELEIGSSEIIISRLGLTDEGSINMVDINSNVYWKANIEQEGEWLSMMPMGGTGELVLEINAEENLDEARQATITFETLDGTKKTIVVYQSSSDEVIYYLYEDMGKESVSNVDVNLYSDWTKRGIGSLVTRYLGADDITVDSAQPSDYEGASGGNNILFSEAGSTLTWGPVNTREQEYFVLSFGLYSPEAFDEADINLYISKDDNTWIKLPYERDNASGWAEVTSYFQVADIPYMYFRVETEKANLRMDDIHILVDPTETGEEVIFQMVIDDGKPEGYVYFEDDFSWITEETFGGTAANFPTNELSYVHAAITEEQRDTIDFYGWTQELGATYFRPGLVKLGKTSVSGDIISPALTAIAEFKAVNVEVSFDIGMYTSAAGAKVDIDGIIIEARNGGTVESQALTSYFTLTEHWVWDKQEHSSEYKNIKVKIYGATSRTQIRISGGIPNSEQVRIGESNRFFFDNFKVTKLAN